MRKNLLLYFLLPIFISFGVIVYLNYYVINFDKNLSVGQSIDTEAEQKTSNLTESKTPTFSYSKLSLPILMYHHIRDYSNPSDEIGTNLSVSPGVFSQQLDGIQSKGYETITFADIKKGEIPEKSIILTFDDGYDDFYNFAFPELKKRNMKGVVFIITDFININGYLSESQILEMRNYGIEIGSHTQSHPDLTSLSKEQAQTEIHDSKKNLENLIGEKIISFCYPAGKFNTELELIVEEANYDFAVTTVPGTALFSKAFELSRFRIMENSNVLTFLE